MKKTGLWALALAGCLLCAPLAGCDGGKNGQNGDELPSSDIDFEALVSEQVTEEQWRAAFVNKNFENCTVQSFTHVDYGQEYFDTLEYARYDVAGEEKYLRFDSFSTIDGVPSDGYAEITHYSSSTNKVRYYDYTYFYSDFDDETEFETGVWYYYPEEEADEDYLDYLTSLTSPFTEICSFFFARYNDFSYDEEIGAYVYVGDVGDGFFDDWHGLDENTVSSLKLKFADGRMAYIYADDGKFYFTLYFYNYGTTVVAIPENAIPIPEDYWE